MSKFNPNIPTIDILEVEATTGYVTLGTCHGVPPSGSTYPSIFAIGALIQDLDGTGVYLQNGTVAVPAWKLIGANSHYVKYAGKITWSGSGVSLATTVTGVAATDIVVASIQTAPTQAAYLVSAAPTTNTVTLVLSAANTSNNAVISYQVLRAA
jgi:hypothetical protein